MHYRESSLTLGIYFKYQSIALMKTFLFSEEFIMSFIKEKIFVYAINSSFPL